jgi:predicted enzyme related to lactoylglutathione lyase
MTPSQPPAPPAVPCAVKGVLTFFYYENLSAAVDFYQRIVGLKKVQDFGWCAILELQPRTYVSLVNATAGSQRPLTGPNKGVQLSIETADLEACLQHMQRLGIASAATALEPGCEGRTVEFKIVDPGGYTVEFFRWL